MDLFNLVVGVFSIAAAIIAIYSFFQSKSAKKKSEIVEAKLIEVQQNIQSLSVQGGSIKAGGDIKAGKGIHAHGGQVVKKQ